MSGTPDCKTSERIAWSDTKYCCQDFRDADIILGLFTYSAPKYYIHGPSKYSTASIDYCPWCAKPIPWKEQI